MKTLVGVALVGSILILAGSGCGGSSSSSAEKTTTESKATTTNPPPPPKATPEQRVQDELGDEVKAGGYAGNVKIQNVDFVYGEVQVTATTPKGGFSGPSCGDLDDGSQAIFKKIYGDTGWKRRASIVYQGGLVSKATGKEVPNVSTGIFTMPAGQAKQIDWSDDAALSNIDWSIYRSFCHQALQ
jgi:hypothetical protein